MWTRFKRWLSRAEHKLMRPFRRPRARLVRVGYEKSGLSVYDEPIAWNADAAMVEALIELPPGSGACKDDFWLRVPASWPFAPAAIERQGSEETFRVLFRFAPPQAGTVALLYWRWHPLVEFALPALSVEEFFRGLRLEAPTVFAYLRGYHTPCRAVVAGQYQGLQAAGLLEGASSLLPVLGMGLRVEFVDRHTGRAEGVPVHLAADQLTARRALVTAAPLWQPAGGAACAVRWAAGDRVLAEHEVQVLSPQQFQNSLYLAGVSPEGDGAVGGGGLRPSFRVASREPGVAALCRLEARVRFGDRAHPPLAWEGEVVVADAPSLCTPVRLPVEDRERIEAVELYSGGRLLAVVPRCPAPTARFDGEGGFVSATDYAWTPFTEAELQEHLRRLLEVPPGTGA